MTGAPYRWSGLLRKAPDGGVEATIVDTMGFTIHLTGTKTDGGYALVGVNGKNPEWAKLPGDDDLEEKNP